MTHLSFFPTLPVHLKVLLFLFEAAGFSLLLKIKQNEKDLCQMATFQYNTESSEIFLGLF